MINSPIDYAAVRADLIARRKESEVRTAELDAAISAVEKIIVSGIAVAVASNATTESTTPPAAKDQMFRGLTIAESAVLYLQSSAKKRQTAKEIADALQRGGYVFQSKDPSNTVNAVLYRAARDRNLLKRVGPALYAALDHPAS